MTAVYSYTEARQKLASVLDQAAQDGEVRVKRRDGQEFLIKPVPPTRSPLDVAGIDLPISAEEIVELIAESRRYS